MRLTREHIIALGPCGEGRDFLASLTFPPEGLDAAGAVEQGATLDDLLWVVGGQTDPEMVRRRRHLAADYAARVLHIFEAAYPGDDRPRTAIVTAREFAEGRASETELIIARDAAGDAGDAGDARAAWAAAWATWTALDAAGALAAGDARAAWAAEATWAAAEEWQLARLVMWFSDVPPEPLHLPETENV